MFVDTGAQSSEMEAWESVASKACAECERGHLVQAPINIASLCQCNQLAIKNGLRGDLNIRKVVALTMIWPALNGKPNRTPWILNSGHCSQKKSFRCPQFYIIGGYSERDHFFEA